MRILQSPAWWKSRRRELRKSGVEYVSSISIWLVRCRVSMQEFSIIPEISYDRDRWSRNLVLLRTHPMSDSMRCDVLSWCIKVQEQAVWLKRFETKAAVSDKIDKTFSKGFSNLHDLSNIYDAPPDVNWDLFVYENYRDSRCLATSLLFWRSLHSVLLNHSRRSRIGSLIQENIQSGQSRTQIRSPSQWKLKMWMVQIASSRSFLRTQQWDQIRVLPALNVVQMPL